MSGSRAGAGAIWAGTFVGTVVLAWPPRVGGVGGGFGGIGVLMPFWQCSRGCRLPLRRRRGCPIALSRDATRAHEHQAGMRLNNERWRYNGMLLAPMRDASAVPERRLLSATRGRKIVGGRASCHGWAGWTLAGPGRPHHNAGRFETAKWPLLACPDPVSPRFWSRWRAFS